MDVADSLVDLIGNTPMVRLDRTARDLECTLVAKLELFNPGGSSKDRIALAMIEARRARRAAPPGRDHRGADEREHRRGPGHRGGPAWLQLHLRLPRQGGRREDRPPARLRRRGRRVPHVGRARAPRVLLLGLGPPGPRGAAGAWKPDQYHNPNNPQAQYDTTGAEIWEQTRGRVTHFVAGIGTGGTVTGIGRYLKERNPAVQIIGADPDGSVYSGGSGRPYLVEGIGEDFWPSTYDPSVVDRVVAVSDAQSFATARRVTREEGLLLGGSGGTAIAAALMVGRDLPPDAVIVVHIPDSGRGYLSKIYNDAWMADYGFLQAAGTTVGDLLAARDPSLPSLVHTHPDETVRQAIAILREYGVSQMPVVKHEPPVVLAEVVGGVTERDLMDSVFTDAAMLDRAVREVMGDAAADHRRRRAGPGGGGTPRGRAGPGRARPRPSRRGHHALGRARHLGGRARAETDDATDGT